MIKDSKNSIKLTKQDLQKIIKAEVNKVLAAEKPLFNNNGFSKLQLGKSINSSNFKDILKETDALIKDYLDKNLIPSGDLVQLQFDDATGHVLYTFSNGREVREDTYISYPLSSKNWTRYYPGNSYNNKVFKAVQDIYGN